MAALLDCFTEIRVHAFPCLPRICVQEVSDQNSEGGVSSDLAILSAAASQLFECTRDMSREAVVSLLSGLRDVSVRNIPTSAVVQPKLFALNRMVEVLLYNIHRIFDLWAIFLRCACIRALGCLGTVRGGSCRCTARAA